MKRADSSTLARPVPNTESFLRCHARHHRNSSFCLVGASTESSKTSTQSFLLNRRSSSLGRFHSARIRWRRARALGASHDSVVAGFSFSPANRTQGPRLLNAFRSKLLNSQRVHCQFPCKNSDFGRNIRLPNHVPDRPVSVRVSTRATLSGKFFYLCRKFECF